MFANPEYKVFGPTSLNTYEVDVFVEKVHKGTIVLTAGQLDGFYRWVKGNALIQNALPDLTADEREMLMTGITASEWDEMFAE